MKITSLSNDAIDAMDDFAADWDQGAFGGRNDYWNALQGILDAGVEVELESALEKSNRLKSRAALNAIKEG